MGCFVLWFNYCLVIGLVEPRPGTLYCLLHAPALYIKPLSIATYIKLAYGLGMMIFWLRKIFVATLELQSLQGFIISNFIRLAKGADSGLDPCQAGLSTTLSKAKKRAGCQSTIMW